MRKQADKKYTWFEVRDIINNCRAKEFLNDITQQLTIVFLEVTKCCPCHCVHCYNQGLRIGKEMSYEDVCLLLDKFADLGLLLVLISGGDPLIRPDIFKIIKYAKKKGFAVRLDTSAVLITEEIAQKLADLYMFWVGLSIYGMSNKSYKLITGVPDGFSRVQRAVEAMVKRGIPLTFKILLFKDNFSDLPKAIKWMQSMKIDSYSVGWQYHPCLDKSRSFAPLRYSLTQRQLKLLKESLPGTVIPAKFVPKDDTPLCKTGNNNSMISVSAYGEISPCIQIPTGANFRDKPIREIFLKNSVFEALRNHTYKYLPKCRDCKDVSYCTPCSAVLYLYTRRLCATHPPIGMCNYLSRAARL